MTMRRILNITCTYNSDYLIQFMLHQLNVAKKLQHV